MLLVLIFSVAACGGGKNNAANSPNTSTNTPETTVEPVKTEKPIELSLWSIWVNDESKPQLDQLKAFEASHPNIKIKMEAIPHDQYKVKVKTSAAGKKCQIYIKYGQEQN